MEELLKDSLPIKALSVRNAKENDDVDNFQNGTIVVNGGYPGLHIPGEDNSCAGYILTLGSYSINAKIQIYTKAYGRGIFMRDNIFAKGKWNSWHKID